jgi:hypothetical protein
MASGTPLRRCLLKRALQLEKNEGGSDYILKWRNCWITVNNLSLFIRKTRDRAVVIEVYAKGHEAGDALGELQVYYDQAKEYIANEEEIAAEEQKLSGLFE